MTKEIDPALQSLFDSAKRGLAEDVFTDQVMSRIDMLRRRAAFGWSGIGLVLLFCAWLLATPLQNAVPLVTQALPPALVESGQHQIAQVFAPVNSIGGIVALTALSLRFIYRKLFS